MIHSIKTAIKGTQLLLAWLIMGAMAMMLALGMFQLADRLGL